MPRRHADRAPEMSTKVTLIEKPDLGRDLRRRDAV
ncbi:hypothetical protein HDG41_007394, partial [Paraburkholderia sp. JPY162]|nr:hypothetical protein [Paraburkholderia youngii]